ncbi:nuclear transport factor 2 family protein [Glycocaulis sp.]
MIRSGFAALCVSAVACLGTASAQEAGDASRAVIQAMYEAASRGDAEAYAAMMSPDIVWMEAENFPYADGNPYVGPEAIMGGVIMRIMADWPEWALAPETFIAEGNRVVVLGRYNGRHGVTGNTISAQFVHVWTVEDGLATAMQQYADTAQVRAAMQLSMD